MIMSSSSDNADLDTIAIACRRALHAAYAFLDLVKRSTPPQEAAPSPVGWRVPTYSKREVQGQTHRFLDTVGTVHAWLEPIDDSLDGPWSRLTAVSPTRKYSGVSAPSMSAWCLAFMDALHEELWEAADAAEPAPNFATIEDEVGEELQTRCAAAWEPVCIRLRRRFADLPDRLELEALVLREHASARFGPSELATKEHLGLRYDAARKVVGRTGYLQEITLDRPLLWRLFLILFEAGERLVDPDVLRMAWEDDHSVVGRNQRFVDAGNISDAMHHLRNALAPLAVRPKVSRPNLGYRLVEGPAQTSSTRSRRASSSPTGTQRKRKS